MCRDRELRFGDQGSRNVEVCSDDQWHAVSIGAIVNNSTRGNISVMAVSPTSVTIGFSLNSLVRAYDLSCTTVSNGQIHSVKVANVSREVTETQISGLAPNTNYECCATAYTMMTSIPIDIISLSCTTTNTPNLPITVQPPATSEVSGNLFMIGFWTILGICFLVLFMCVGFIIACLIALKQQTKSLKYSPG